ncbi:MAG: lipid-A-disaccharide synthase, partial [Verrucomicrobia bacterium]
LIAGEASGDLLAAELVKALKQSPEVQAMAFPPAFFGAGGPEMAEAGVELAVDLTQHSVIGLFDALKKYREFKPIFDQLFLLALERGPDAIICVDFSGFNHRFAHAVKNHVRAREGTFLNWNPKIVQYVSPQVWASRPGPRVQKLRVEFVGHPMVERFTNYESRITSQHPNDEPIINRPWQILLLPGSRVTELRRHLPLLTATARKIRETKPETRFKMVLPGEELKRLADQPSTRLSDLQIQIGGLAQALAETDLAITKSGTVTLECAYSGVPAVVFYKTSLLSYLAGRMAVSVEHLAMPNLLAGEEVFPEFIQHDATAENIARAALELLNNAGRRNVVKTKLARIIKSLGGPGASRRAAAAVLSLLAQEPLPIRAVLTA